MKENVIKSICLDINNYFEGDGISAKREEIVIKLHQAIENSSVYEVAKKMLEIFGSDEFNSSSVFQSALSDDEIKECVESCFEEFDVELNDETRKLLSVSFDEDIEDF